LRRRPPGERWSADETYVKVAGWWTSTQRPAAVSEDPQRCQLLVISDLAQPAHAGRGERDGVRVGGVGLAALAGGEQPDPRA
jgi:hypothetical protein